MGNHHALTEKFIPIGLDDIIYEIADEMFSRKLEDPFFEVPEAIYSNIDQSDKDKLLLMLKSVISDISKIMDEFDKTYGE